METKRENVSKDTIRKGRSSTDGRDPGVFFGVHNRVTGLPAYGNEPKKRG